MYKIDQDLVGLGFEGPDAYLRDENGNPVPETVRKEDTKAMRFCLEVAPSRNVGQAPEDRRSARGWRTCHRCDVTKKPEYNTAASVKARKWKAGSRRIREEKE